VGVGVGVRVRVRVRVRALCSGRDYTPLCTLTPTVVPPTVVMCVRGGDRCIGTTTRAGRACVHHFCRALHP
jgi:hypothetical protein